MSPGRGAPAPGALPAGAKDVLSVEAAELRTVEAALRRAFEAFGYREVMTPVLEFAEVIDRAQEGGLRDAFRLFDAEGRVLVLRPDITIPIARLVATRMADHPGPVRVSYLARVFRPPAPGRPRASEQRQAGVELVGEAGPGADAEAIALLVQSLRATGLEGLRVGVGDVSLTRAVLDGLGIDAGAREELNSALAARNFVEWRRLAREAMPEGPGAALLVDLPSLRGGRELLERIAGEVPAAVPACERLSRLLDLLGVPRRRRRRDPRPGRAARLALLLGRGHRGVRARRRRADRGGRALRRPGRPVRPDRGRRSDSPSPSTCCTRP